MWRTEPEPGDISSPVSWKPPWLWAALVQAVQRCLPGTETFLLTLCPGRVPVFSGAFGPVVDESRGHLRATQDREDPHQLGQNNNNNNTASRQLSDRMIPQQRVITGRQQETSSADVCLETSTNSTLEKSLQPSPRLSSHSRASWDSAPSRLASHKPKINLHTRLFVVVVVGLLF